MGRDSIAVESCLSGESRMLDVGHGLPGSPRVSERVMRTERG